MPEKRAIEHREQKATPPGSLSPKHHSTICSLLDALTSKTAFLNSAIRDLLETGAISLTGLNSVDNLRLCLFA